MNICLFLPSSHGCHWHAKVLNHNISLLEEIHLKCKVITKKPFGKSLWNQINKINTCFDLTPRIHSSSCALECSILHETLSVPVHRMCSVGSTSALYNLNTNWWWIWVWENNNWVFTKINSARTTMIDISEKILVITIWIWMFSLNYYPW